MAESGSDPGVVIAGLTHDLLARRSLVTFTWAGVADKRLVLDVPFGCPLADLPAAAEAALRAFAADLATVLPPRFPEDPR